MARPGYSRIALLVALNAIAWLVPQGAWRWWLGIPVAVLLLLVLNFYRDPDREVPERDGVFAVAPADGHVVAVTEHDGGLELSIFMSALDVHVNRAPVAGTVTSRTHHAGRYLPAFLARSQTENERETLIFESPEVGRVSCTQVAGLLARRIENWVEPGDELALGQRYGMIHLGSRLDLEFPTGFVALVRRGQHVKAGTTVLAERRDG